ncbi:MAG: hypothetical protein QN147_11150 [Armatimonadota bacterium]|nr:hypothetical protein [Armatimonadota bacterium]
MTMADLHAAARFVWKLRGHLRDPLDRTAAAAIVRRRLERRAADFLRLVDAAVYANPRSPYRRLLALAGCEPGDLHALVAREGVEGALAVLFRSGVYLTVDEFKGRRPAQRGSAVVTVSPTALCSPLRDPRLPAYTGGSGGAPSPVAYDLPSIRDRAVNALLALEAQGGLAWVKAVWGLSAGSAPVVLRYSSFGASVARWFVQVPPTASGLHPRYRWVSPALRLAAALAGRGLPRPEVVPVGDPLPIARWMAQTLRAGAVPHLYGFASPIVRLCQAASQARIDIRGARVTMTGEAVTAARLAVVRAAGVVATMDYGAVDAGGPVSHGCLRPSSPDDAHFFHDLHALIQPGPGAHGLPPRALLLTSLRLTSPLVLLNVSIGDQAVVERRPCGCPLGAFGWETHLSAIRSFEKLTAAGMTFLDTDVVGVLEEELPARFGGGPADYQLVEEEAADGATVILAVHPRLGPLDAEAVREVFLAAIGRGDGAERIMALNWRRAGLPRVERRPPAASARGKVPHVWRAYVAESEASALPGGAP